MVNWLEAQPGGSWQDRWLASGAEDAADWRILVAGWKTPCTGTPAPGPARPAPHAGAALLVLICADVIRPGIGWLLSCPAAPRNLAAEMARVRDPAAFAELTALCQSGSVGAFARLAALDKIAVIMAARGGTPAAATVGDCIELLDVVAAVRTGKDRHPHSPLFYQLLRSWGAFGQDAPAAIRVLAGRGKPTCEQLIDRYGIACQPVRDVLVDYLRERQRVDGLLLAAESGLPARQAVLGRPGSPPARHQLPQAVPRDTATAWKQRVMTRTTTTLTSDGQRVADDDRQAGRPQRADRSQGLLPRHRRMGRRGPGPVGTARRALPGQRQRRLPQERPLPAQVPDGPADPGTAAGAARPGRPGPMPDAPPAAERLQAARDTPAGSLFTAGGQTLRRAVMKTETTGRIWAEDPATGKRRDLTFEEHRGFWCWAMVEVLRHTGIRIEELTELSHHSLIQYRLPASRELIPLLQIAPSKTDEERLLVVSPELADVLSAIMRRIRGTTAGVPLVVSYDKNERVYNPPMPLLFQWRCRLENRPVGETSLRSYLDDALAAIGVKDASGHALRYTFHDFSRIFITDAILHGMPPHIAQLVAGHRDINTTMGYKAVYPEEVINGHRAFIARRRSLRPAAEYRVPTDEEWAGFLGHFERRKVALGDCGRSYDTPCIHEHSCLRCPLLRPDPGQRPRLAADLRQPDRPHRRSRSKPLARRGRGPEGQPRRRPGQARPDEPDRSRRSAAINLGMPDFATPPAAPSPPRPPCPPAGRPDDRRHRPAPPGTARLRAWHLPGRSRCRAPHRPRHLAAPPTTSPAASCTRHPRHRHPRWPRSTGPQRSPPSTPATCPAAAGNSGCCAWRRASPAEHQSASATP